MREIKIILKGDMESLKELSTKLVNFIQKQVNFVDGTLTGESNEIIVEVKRKRDDQPNQYPWSL